MTNVWIPPVPHGLASLRQDTSEMESGVESSRTKSTVVGPKKWGTRTGFHAQEPHRVLLSFRSLVNCMKVGRKGL